MLLEGARRLPSGTLVLRRVLWTDWSLARAVPLGLGISLVGWLIPASLPLVLVPDAAVASPLGLRRVRSRLAARSRRVRIELTVLRIGGMLVIASVVLLVPYATWSRGTEGLLGMLALLALLDTILAAITVRALRRTGFGRSAALRAGIPLLWPFNALHAAEIVQCRVVDGVPRLAVARDLLGELVFMTTLRPMIYDAVNSGRADAEAGLLHALAETSSLASFLRSPPSGGAGTFCPRCGTSYERGRTECSDCAVELLAG